jgi:hypothetical protein
MNSCPAGEAFSTLLAQGVKAEDIKLMSRDVPRKLCGIK